MSKIIELEKKVRKKGEEIAEDLRRFFRERGIFTVNLIGSPGAGKTSLLESVVPKLSGQVAVIEGDLQTDEDKKRMDRLGIPAYQINTLGACHLDAGMIRTALEEFPLRKIRYLFIENVGNLVCPAGFEIGEDIKVAVVSVAEGDDKPAKYPTAVRVSSALVLTKTDLLPHVDCNVARMEQDARSVHPEIAVFQTSARTGKGLDDFLTWLEEKARDRCMTTPME